MGKKSRKTCRVCFDFEIHLIVSKVRILLTATHGRVVCTLSGSCPSFLRSDKRCIFLLVFHIFLSGGVVETFSTKNTLDKSEGGAFSINFCSHVKAFDLHFKENSHVRGSARGGVGMRLLEWTDS